MAAWMRFVQLLVVGVEWALPQEVFAGFPQFDAGGFDQTRNADLLL
jgi:hypothetical protein